jgi:hypothetical protein
MWYEVPENAALAAAAAWLSLSPQERGTFTAIYASGRALRGQVNEAVQTGLKANGELGRQSVCDRYAFADQHDPRGTALR